MTNPQSAAPGSAPFDLNSMIATAVDTHVGSALQGHLNAPQFKSNMAGHVFKELGDLLRHFAHQFQGGVNANEFLVPPVQFPDQSCVVLLNKTCPVPNAFHVLTTLFAVPVEGSETSQIGRNMTIFAIKDDDLAESNYLNLDQLPPPYIAELNRQLDAILAATADESGNIKLTPRLFTMMHIPQNIDGYTYYEAPKTDEPEAPAADAPAANDTTVTSTDTPAEPVVIDAPVPAATDVSDATIVAETPAAAPVVDTPAAPVADAPAADVPAQAPVDSSVTAAVVADDQAAAPIAAPVADAPVDTPAPAVEVAVAPAATDTASADNSAPAPTPADPAAPAA